jgi:hypothetical protein
VPVGDVCVAASILDAVLASEIGLLLSAPLDAVPPELLCPSLPLAGAPLDVALHAKSAHSGANRKAR